MRRALPIVALAAIIVAVAAVVALGSSGSDDGAYRVRAIFSSAFSVIPGEDVKVAGVRVGKIDALEVTPDHKAAVVLLIQEKGFRDFRSDATCTIRPQSLIGERFVECTPTQPREQGAPAAAPLRKIESGEGKGQYLLPVSQTRRPVDLDLVNNIMRLPYRQRFSIILNELGVGLTANGDELRQAIRNASPALEQTDRVLKIVAEQNEILAKLATDSDKVLAPLARDREKVADFVTQAKTVSQASAERRADIEETLKRFPAFLTALRPTMRDLGSLADEMTPVLTDLGEAAPGLSRAIEQLGPFSEAATPALTTLGDTADTGREALLTARPLIGDLGTFASTGKPVIENLAKLLTSLRDTGGVENLMQTLLYSTTSINGFDSFGHYLRAILLVNTCSSYVTENDAACTANFTESTEDGGDAEASAAKSSPAGSAGGGGSEAGNSPWLKASRAILSGASVQEAQQLAGLSSTPGATPEGAKSAAKPAAKATATGAAPTASQQPEPVSAEATRTLLDYLLGD